MAGIQGGGQTDTDTDTHTQTRMDMYTPYPVRHDSGGLDEKNKKLLFFKGIAWSPMASLSDRSAHRSTFLTHPLSPPPHPPTPPTPTTAVVQRITLGYPVNINVTRVTQLSVQCVSLSVCACVCKYVCVFVRVCVSLHVTVTMSVSLLVCVS